MDAGNETVGHCKATSPAKALREFFGDDLASQDGRYGKLKDGRSVVALTNVTRVTYADARTTRLLHGKEVR